MPSLNKVQLIGHLGADPEVKYTPSGAAVANFNIATNEKWTSKDGKKEERVEWHKIVVWNKLAEHCGEYLAKGRAVYVEGKPQTRKWTDKDGNDRYTTEVIAQSIQFLGGPSGENKPNSNQRSESAAPLEVDDSDIPF